MATLSETSSWSREDRWGVSAMKSVLHGLEMGVVGLLKLGCMARGRRTIIDWIGLDWVTYLCDVNWRLRKKKTGIRRFPFVGNGWEIILSWVRFRGSQGRPSR